MKTIKLTLILLATLGTITVHASEKKQADDQSGSILSSLASAATTVASYIAPTATNVAVAAESYVAQHYVTKTEFERRLIELEKRKKRWSLLNCCGFSCLSFEQD